MPDGSPIDQWWKSHRPATVTTIASKAIHLMDRWPRAYCGHRNGTQTTVGEDVTCSACISARKADAESADHTKASAQHA